MKKLPFFIFMLLLISSALFAQVSINSDGSQPDNSAMLDVKSSNTGFLFPRLSDAARNSLPSPGTGLLIYNTSTNLLNYFNGSQWFQVEISVSSATTGSLRPGGGVSINETNAPPDSSAMLDINNPSRGVLIPRTTSGSVTGPARGLIIYNNATNLINYYNGSVWQELCAITTGVSGSTGNQNSVGVAINTDGAPTHQSAILEVSSNDKGVLIPRLTENQRNAVLPVTGLIIYNLNSDEIEFYNGSNWCKLIVSFLSVPTEGTHVPSLTQIVWKWNIVTGATGYKWSATNNFATATDMGTATSKTETGLTCNTVYIRYAWAYNTCGNSTPVTLTKSTLTNPPPTPTAGTHVASITQIVWKWNPVTGATGYKWGTTNNYALATEMGTATAYTETGLTCNTAYTRYAWAYVVCGNSTAVTLTKSTLMTDPPATPTAGTNVSSLTQIIWNWNTVSGATGYKWNTTNSYSTAIDMGTVTTKTETGLTSYTIYLRYVWAYSACGNSSSVILNDTTCGIPPSAPTAGTHVPSPGQIIWNWNAVAGATGYKWYDTDDYNFAFDMGTLITITETQLNPNTTYTRYVWAYNVCGNSAATALTDTTSSCAWNCGQPITDSRDGKTYNTVQITHQLGAQFGKQCWMKENLNIGSRIEGYVEQTNNGVIEKHCYENSDANCNMYGGLYEWDEMMKYNTSLDSMALGKKWGICPTGWHVPGNEELTQLITWLGGDDVAGGKMKESGTSHWWIPNSGATNSSGFTGLPAGWRTNSGTGPQDSVFQFQGQNGYFWTSTWSASPDTNFSWGRYLHYSNDNVGSAGYHHTMGLSVRCIKDIGASGSFSCGDSMIINHVANTVAPVTKTVTYGTVTGIPGEACKCWITSNLGADHQATWANDATEASAGWYWQFNRKQGYKHDGTTRTPNTTWITSINENLDWQAANDPCTLELGAGWRIPTGQEWNNVLNAGGWEQTNIYGPWESGLKLHGAGYLYTDALYFRGIIGDYWSSTQYGATYGKYLYISGSVGCYILYHSKAGGNSIRCLRE